MAQAGVRSRVGNYEVIAEIADTALGALSVGRALVGDERGRLALLRRLERGRPLSDADLASVRESAIAALRIHDAGVLAVLELLPVENGLVIVSEYIEGLPLRVVLDAARNSGTPLPGPVAVKLGSDLLRAVLGAKRALAEATVLAPLVGLTPDGVLLASSGDVLISGLGLAMLARPIDSPDLLAYRAPEHFSGSVPDERSEVYSVGVLLWELLAGKNPLDGSRDRAALLQQIRSVGLPRLERAAPASLSPAVAALVMQAVARDPAQRIPNLGALANALMALGKAHNVRLTEVLKAVEPLVRSPLERLRAALEVAQQGVPQSGPAQSMRPTFRPPAPGAPKAARAIGLAAFPRASAVPRIDLPRADLSTESARRVDDLLSAPASVDRGAAPAFPLPLSGATRAGIGPGAEEDRRQVETAVSELRDFAARPGGVPGLPVGTTAPIPLMAPAAAAPSPASTRAAPSWSPAAGRTSPLPADDISAIDEDALRPRPARRLALAFVVLLVLGAAGAIGVMAFNRMQQQTASANSEPLPGLPAPQVGGAGQPAPAASEVIDEATGQRTVSGSQRARPRAPMAFRTKAPLGVVVPPAAESAPEPAPPPPAPAAAPTPPEPAPGVALPPPPAATERVKEPLEENPY